ALSAHPRGEVRAPPPRGHGGAALPRHPARALHRLPSGGTDPRLLGVLRRARGRARGSALPDDPLPMGKTLAAASALERRRTDRRGRRAAGHPPPLRRPATTVRHRDRRALRAWWLTRVAPRGALAGRSEEHTSEL